MPELRPRRLINGWGKGHSLPLPPSCNTLAAGRETAATVAALEIFSDEIGNVVAEGTAARLGVKQP
jgi:hypothetical protein